MAASKQVCYKHTSAMQSLRLAPINKLMLHLPVPVRVPKEGRQQRNTCEGSPTPAKGQQEQWLIGFKCHNSKLVMEKLQVKLKEAEEKEVGTYKRKSLINVVSANQAQW